jgi:fused signal recognition particle receptor
VTGTILTLIIAGVVIVVGLVTGLVVGSRRRPLGRAIKPELEERAEPQRSDQIVGGPAVDEREADTSQGGATVETEAVEELTTEAPEAEPGTLQPTPTIERPEAPQSRLVRLRQRLAGSNNALSRGLLALLSRDRIDEETWEDFEDTLLTSDLGVKPTMELVEALRNRLRVEGISEPAQARTALREELVKLVDPTLDRSLATNRTETPAVVMVVGVNGTGKTTTCGKLARVLVAEDKDVLLGAADTFRAAAADQLETWGSRVGVPTVRGAEGADPASVAFEAVKAGIEVEADVVIVDTAGRLHTKTGLMDELGKVKRVIERQAPVREVLLVLDATTGQNGMIQARIFAEVVDITGIVLTKLDGTAKGGIVIQVQRELGVPVKLVGLGEGVDDLAPFDAEVFVDALLSPAAA